MKKNLPPARVMMSSTIFRFVYPNRERERERETLLVYCWPLGSIGMKFVTHPAPCWRTAHLVTLQQTDIKKRKKEEEEESGAKQWRHRHHAGHLLLPALVLDEIEPRRTVHVRQHCRGKYLELPNDVWNIPHRIPRSVWLSTSRAQHNQIHFYTATSSDISQPIVSLLNKSSKKIGFQNWV